MRQQRRGERSVSGGDGLRITGFFFALLKPTLGTGGNPALRRQGFRSRGVRSGAIPPDAGSKAVEPWYPEAFPAKVFNFLDTFSRRNGMGRA